jgi:hypothetical protein
MNGCGMIKSLIASSHSSLLSRVIFLSYSLISADSVTDQQVQSICDSVNPSIFRNIHHEDINIREFTLRYIIALGKHSLGRTQLTPHASDILHLLKNQYDSTAISEKADVYDTELELVQELRTLLH